MRSKTTERILSETPQEVKEEVREFANKMTREQQLLSLGFEKKGTSILFSSLQVWK